MNVAPIPSNFRRDGYDYELLHHRTFHHLGWVYAIYAQSRDSVVHAWEVVRARFQRERTTPMGVVYPDGYKLPSSERWGKDGWTTTSLATAEELFNALVAEAEQKKAA